MIFYKTLLLKKQKPSNTNNYTRVNLNNELSLNSCLTTVSDKLHYNNFTFDNLNNKHKVN